MTIEKFKDIFNPSILDLEKNVAYICDKLFGVDIKELGVNSELPYQTNNNDLCFANYLSNAYAWLKDICMRGVNSIEEFFCEPISLEPEPMEKCPLAYEHIYSINEVLNVIARKFDSVLNSLTDEPIMGEAGDCKAPSNIESWLCYLSDGLLGIIARTETIINFIIDGEKRTAKENNESLNNLKRITPINKENINVGTNRHN